MIGWVPSVGVEPSAALINTKSASLFCRGECVGKTVRTPALCRIFPTYSAHGVGESGRKLTLHLKLGLTLPSLIPRFLSANTIVTRSPTANWLNVVLIPPLTCHAR